ncbi:MAG: hypothetical protein RJA25_161 [Bacteroidota bacterium]|jgi:outer membrane protein
MRQLYFILTFLFLVSSNTLPAQEVWDWQKCIDYAFKNNLQVKQSDINIQLGESNLKQQKLNYSPSVNASTNYNLRLGNNYDFYANTYTKALVHYQDYGVNLSQPIFDGLMTPNNIKKSKIDLQAIKLDQAVLKNNIQMQILAAFLNIMNANEQYQQAINQKTSTQEQYERMQTLIKAGGAAEKAILDIDAQLTSEELTISQIKNQLDLAYLNLKILLQLDVKQNITVQIPELPKTFNVENLQDINTIYSDALSLRPEIKSSQLKVQSAKKQIAVARGNYSPVLNFVANTNTFFSSQSVTYKQQATGNNTAVGFVEGTFQRVLIPEIATISSKNPYKNQLKQNLGYAFGASLNIPIYNKYQVQTAVKQAKLQYENTLLTEKQAELDLFNSIQQAYIKAEAAIANYKSSQRNLETAQKSYDYAVERLNVGAVNQLEVNLAKTNLMNAESKWTQSKYEYVFNTKLLDFYQGKKIEL